MLSFSLRRTALVAAAAAAAAVSVTMAGSAVQAADAAVASPAGGTPSSHVSSVFPPSASPSPGSGTTGTASRQHFVPDLIAAVPGGITAAELASIGKLSGVVAVLPVDGGKIKVNGESADVLGVSPQAFRPWTPLSTAESATVWSDLSQGELISTNAAALKLHLTAGKSYPVSAAILEQVPFGGTTALSVNGADAVVNLTRSLQLGLAKNFAVLISATQGANLKTLTAQVQSVVGKRGQVVNLVSYALITAGSQPVETPAPVGVPATWLDLFKQSAELCPGLSWTVLAAIAEIESGDGANDGPSTAGAEGPMQFLPSTWAIWGTDGFGPTGTPEIENPLDAVPSAARMLCADGAASSATLAGAIFDYNHATWYVDEVLALASEYAQTDS